MRQRPSEDHVIRELMRRELQTHRFLEDWPRHDEEVWALMHCAVVKTSLRRRRLGDHLAREQKRPYLAREQRGVGPT